MRDFGVFSGLRVSLTLLIVGALVAVIAGSALILMSGFCQYEDLQITMPARLNEDGVAIRKEFRGPRGTGTAFEAFAQDASSVPGGTNWWRLSVKRSSVPQSQVLSLEVHVPVPIREGQVFSLDNKGSSFEQPHPYLPSPVQKSRGALERLPAASDGRARAYFRILHDDGPFWDYSAKGEMTVTDVKPLALSVDLTLADPKFYNSDELRPDVRRPPAVIKLKGDMTFQIHKERRACD